MLVFYGVCMYVRPKLTLVSLFLCFFFCAPSPYLIAMCVCFCVNSLYLCVELNWPKYAANGCTQRCTKIIGDASMRTSSDSFLRRIHGRLSDASDATGAGAQI